MRQTTAYRYVPNVQHRDTSDPLISDIGNPNLKQWAKDE